MKSFIFFNLQSIVIILLAFVPNGGQVIANDHSLELSEQIETTTDQRSIQRTINTLFQATDQRDWQAVSSVLASEVAINYQALGGEAATKTPNEILTTWKALLPGFYRTIHQTANEAIWVAGRRASATMNAVATHYRPVESDESFWTVIVGYDMEFIQEGEQWKIARIDLSLYEQLGNLALAPAAMKAVEAGDIHNIIKDLSNVEGFDAYDPARLLNNWKAFSPNTYSIHRAGAAIDSGVKLRELSFNSNGNELKGPKISTPSSTVRKISFGSMPSTNSNSTTRPRPSMPQLILS